MIDMEALRKDLTDAGWTVTRPSADGLLFVERNYGAGHLVDIHVMLTDDCWVTAYGYEAHGKVSGGIPVDAAFRRAVAIIDRHITEATKS